MSQNELKNDSPLLFDFFLSLLRQKSCFFIFVHSVKQMRKSSVRQAASASGLFGRPPLRRRRDLASATLLDVPARFAYGWRLRTSVSLVDKFDSIKRHVLQSKHRKYYCRIVLRRNGASQSGSQTNALRRGCLANLRNRYDIRICSA